MERWNGARAVLVWRPLSIVLLAWVVAAFAATGLSCEDALKGGILFPGVPFRWRAAVFGPIALALLVHLFCPRLISRALIAADLLEIPTRCVFSTKEPLRFDLDHEFRLAGAPGGPLAQLLTTHLKGSGVSIDGPSCDSRRWSWSMVGEGLSGSAHLEGAMPWLVVVESVRGRDSFVSRLGSAPKVRAACIELNEVLQALPSVSNVRWFTAREYEAWSANGDWG